MVQNLIKDISVMGNVSICNFAEDMEICFMWLFCIITFDKNTKS